MSGLSVFWRAKEIANREQFETPNNFNEGAAQGTRFNGFKKEHTPVGSGPAPKPDSHRLITELL